MPIFQDPDRGRFYGSWSAEPGGDDEGSRPPARCTKDKRNNAEAIQMSGPSPVDDNMENYSLPRLHTSDREELIHRIKRGQSPTWVPNRSSEKYVNRHTRSSESLVPGLQNTGDCRPENDREDGRNMNDQEVLSSPAEIERPRSALHSGDFREGSTQERNQEPTRSTLNGQRDGSHSGYLASSPTTPWYSPSVFSPRRRENDTNSKPPQAAASPSRSRAPSMGSSYVLKAPTSPLVYQANNTDLDYPSNVDLMDLSDTPEKANRSHSRAINFSRPRAPTRREESFPSQASQPRRSLTSAYSLQLASSPHSPTPRSRRPSFTSDISPMHHAPMVGSYEESILRGRMSTTPSKPLDFTAQIGVLGKGKCKPNLKCPPHVTVPFPAVFYSYPTSGSDRSISDDSPSPYVGLIDLENSLPREDPNAHRRRRRHTSPAQGDAEHCLDDSVNTKMNHNDQLERRMRDKRHRRSQSPKAPPGGSYRIPQQGQLQIVIKNPNKTAVKLFLVPYDLSDMEPGTKTFIRQRSYSAGPIIDMPLSARKNLGTDRLEASLNPTDDPKDKPVLRYLIHLNICCPSKGRYYLYSSIRVVFANRVPDGKEKLRNETHYPEPRYSPYKPSRETPSGSAGARLAAEKALRRRSGGMALGGGPMPFDSPAHVPSPYPRCPSSSSFGSKVAAIPFQLPLISTRQPTPDADRYQDEEARWMPTSSQQPTSPSMPQHYTDSQALDSSGVKTSESTVGLYSKLNKGDVGYGGYPFGSLSSGSDTGESLLAKRLRGLGVQKKEEEGSN
ncbi:hypothetical protein VTN02DRAFT_2518 [Thermoascus thermophilus]